MDEVYVVRHKVLVEGRSVRQVAQEMGIARNTVRRYVRGAPPGVRRAAARSRPVMDAVRARAEAILGEAPRWTGGKQRLTATRLHRMLVEEGQRVGETVVKAIVREWRRRRQEVFVPLVYKPGDLAQVDFFEVLVDIEGDRRKAFLFVMRLMHSGRDFAWLYPRQDQVCFLDGHARAFSHFGAVPHRLAYDNFKAAVARILVGSERVLSARFLALTTHYLFEASFARPYTGHDKGGVEARGKGIRWQELVPGPARTRGLCADAAGFGLHAATRAGAGGARAREALVKYILRPPMANEHLTLRSDGLVRVALKRPFRDGTIAVDMDPLSLLCRLAAAVPPPRQHTVRVAASLKLGWVTSSLFVSRLQASKQMGDRVLVGLMTRKGSAIDWRKGLDIGYSVVRLFRSK
jgi:transposase